MAREVKTVYTAQEIEKLKELIRQRVAAPSDKQKAIRDKMRDMGFYGSEFGIYDCQVSDLDALIANGTIKVLGAPKPAPQPRVNEIVPVEKPWHKKSSYWAWITVGVIFIILVILLATS